MNKTKKGFTLIELLVVVLIIGILSAVALPQYNKVVEKSRATEAVTNLKSIADAKVVAQLATGCGSNLSWDDLDITFYDLYLCGSYCGSSYSGSSYGNNNFAYVMDGYWCDSNNIRAPYAIRQNSNYYYELYYCPGRGVRCEGSDCKKAGFSRYTDCISSACYAM